MFAGENFLVGAGIACTVFAFVMSIFVVTLKTVHRRKIEKEKSRLRHLLHPDIVVQYPTNESQLRTYNECRCAEIMNDNPYKSLTCTCTLLNPNQMGMVRKPEMSSLLKPLSLEI